MAKVLAGRGGIEELRAAVPLLETAAELRDDAAAVAWLMSAPLFLRDAETGRELRARVDEAPRRAPASARCRACCSTSRATRRPPTVGRGRRPTTPRRSGWRARPARPPSWRCRWPGLSWLESRTRAGGGVPGARRGGAGALRRSRHPLGLRRGRCSSLGDLELSLGDPGAALEHLRALDRAARELRSATPTSRRAPELVEVLLRLGRADEAARDRGGVRRAQPTRRASRGRWRGPLAAAGCLADDFDAPFEQALALHAQTLDRFETARTALAYGARLRRAGRRVDARVHLRAALDTFSALGAGLGRPGRGRARPDGRAGAAPRRRRGRDADAAGAAGRAAPGRRPDHPGGRGRAVPQPEDGRVPPAQGLHEARHPVAGGAGERGRRARA